MKPGLFAAVVLYVAATSPALAQPNQQLRALADTGVLSDLRWPNFTRLQPDVTTFYESSGYQLAWVRAGEASPQARAIIHTLEASEIKGLDPEDYDGSRWSDRLSQVRTDAGAVRFDLALTVSAMRYISDVSSGKVNPEVFSLGLRFYQKKCDLPGTLRELTNARDVAADLDRLEPPFEGYWRTEKALAEYVKLAGQDEGEVLPATKKPVEPSDQYPGAQRLERLLRLVGDLRPNNTLVEALKRFQIRHGIEPDGCIGKATLKELNTPLSQRVRQLQLVLERWRWVPHSFPRPPIVVNIPEFRLRAYDDQYRPELEMKVVVGKAYRHKTPVFSGNMTHLIFRPYWDVPLSIQRAELVPQIAKDPGYLAHNDYEIVNSKRQVVSSSSVSADLLTQLRSGRLFIRQVPGREERARTGQVSFPQPVQCIPAQHAGEIVVLEIAPRFQSRLHPRGEA